MRGALPVCVLAGLVVLTNPYPTPNTTQHTTLNAAPAVIHTVVCQATAVEGAVNASTLVVAAATPSACIH
jgi:hypothetical protein